jgi:hypothetical protein
MEMETADKVSEIQSRIVESTKKKIHEVKDARDCVEQQLTKMCELYQQKRSELLMLDQLLEKLQIRLKNFETDGKFFFDSSACYVCLNLTVFFLDIQWSSPRTIIQDFDVSGIFLNIFFTEFYFCFMFCCFAISFFYSVSQSISDYQ